MIPLLAVIDPEHQPLRVFLFFLITLGLIGGSLLLVRRVRDYELVILGLVVAAAAIGYHMVGMDADVGATAGAGGSSVGVALGISLGSASGALMKIAIVLVLAGVARSLLMAWSGTTPAETTKP
jgi:hypothetical protein